MPITLNPISGLRDTTQFPDEPGSSAAAREQIQSVIDQVASQAASKTIENWIAPTLLNGWVNAGGSYATAGYCKDDMGVVRLRGTIKNGSLPITLFNLPAGYRPIQDLLFIVNSNNAVGAVSITSAGLVYITAGSNTLLSLDNIIFRTE